MKREGNHARGERHGMSKLTLAQVETIRSMQLPSRTMAAIMCVDESHIRAIRRGKVWRHATQQPGGGLRGPTVRRREQLPRKYRRRLYGKQWPQGTTTALEALVRLDLIYDDELAE